MLEGQVKISFEKWYCEVHNPSNKLIQDHYYFYVSDNFDSMHPSEKFGVYVDFFDSVGLMIEIKRELQFGDFYVQINDKEYKGDRFRLRPEARSSSLSKASQIFNERLLSTSTNKENQEKLK